MHKKSASSSGKKTQGAKVLHAAGLAEQSEVDAKVIVMKHALGHWQGMAGGIHHLLKSQSTSSRRAPTGPELDKQSLVKFAHLRK